MLPIDTIIFLHKEIKGQITELKKHKYHFAFQLGLAPEFRVEIATTEELQETVDHLNSSIKELCKHEDELTKEYNLYGHS